jgi:N-acetylmuramoyl-L-alanine amidase
MTRNNFTDNVGENAKDTINERAKIANRAKCDYFISIHCNAGGGTGTETLIYGTGGHAEPLAKCVNNKIVKHFGLKNRGIKVRTDLGVLRLTNMPAILVETAFIDNQSDANLLKHNINEFAQAIYDGITEYLDVKTEEVDMSVQQAIEILKSKAGLEDQTINFLLCYKYREALVVKLAEAMK